MLQKYNQKLFSLETSFFLVRSEIFLLQWETEKTDKLWSFFTKGRADKKQMTATCQIKVFFMKIFQKINTLRIVVIYSNSVELGQIRFSEFKRI